MLSVKGQNRYGWINDHDLFVFIFLMEPCRFHDIYYSSYTSLQAWNKCQVSFWSDRSFKDLLNGVQCRWWAQCCLSDLCRDRLCSSLHPTSAGCAVAYSVRPVVFVAALFPLSLPTGWTDAPPLFHYLKPYVPMPAPTATINVSVLASFPAGSQN